MRWWWALTALVTLSFGADGSGRALESSFVCRYTEADIAKLEARIAQLEANQRAIVARIKQLERLLVTHDKVLKTLWKERNTAQKGVPAPADSNATTRFKPTLFQTKAALTYYDKPGGRALGQLPEGYRLTAYLKKGGWIRISGHFPHKKWEDFGQEAWVRQEALKKIR